MSFRSYSQQNDKIKRFLKEYVEEIDGVQTTKYFDILMRVSQREINDIHIYLDDLLKFDIDLGESVISNTRRYVSMFNACIQELLPKTNIRDTNNLSQLDVFIDHRKLIQQQAVRSGATKDLKDSYPLDLLRNFEVRFHSPSDRKPISVRDLKAEHIGKLVSFKGIVTRCTEVKPMLTIATYLCDRCGAETFQPISSSSFTPLEICPSQECTTNKTNGRLYLQTRGSKFVKHQELKMQEFSDQVPAGHVPRYATVIAYGDITRLAVPGNYVSVTGIFLPSSRTTFRQMTQGLLFDTYVEAHSISQIAKTEQGEIEGLEFSSEELKSVLSQPDLYSKLANSIAPEIFGHDDIKKALLLLLVGGVEHISSDLKIRGNINILLMGDPGVAKSQILSYIDRIAPRSQLTTGKGSSGVGLTAAVVHDKFTGELMLEGGSLVLADQGICCIDEFDKIDENDRTAIHEVMEQQTVSIAKAGIFTTLNARVSILAAANPAFGRYDTKRSLEQNVQLPAALLSRFDLLWLIRDKPDKQNDFRLAQHITYVHRNKAPPQAAQTIFQLSIIRRYLAHCKNVNPTIPESLKEFLVASYVQIRKDARLDRNSSYTSPRTLLSILRLASALARLRLVNQVEKEDVQEAIRLMESSKVTIRADSGSNKKSRPEDVIYGIIRDICTEKSSKKVDYEEARLMCMARGFTASQFAKCLEDYENLNVWQVSSSKTQIIII